jgi:hypothetical protein
VKLGDSGVEISERLLQNLSIPGLSASLKVMYDARAGKKKVCLLPLVLYFFF